jgi:uncharacterized protein
MSHFSEYGNDAQTSDGRHLGDEWADWDGRDDASIREGKGLFLAIAGIASALFCAGACGFVYLVTPRLALWHPWFPAIAWALAAGIVVFDLTWFALLAATAIRGRRIAAAPARLRFCFDLTFAGAFRVAEIARLSRDRLGHSFVRASNALSRAAKPAGREERLLLLLPRCLAKEQLQEIAQLKERYPIAVHTVSGGELARKKVKELRPTAVIGVACERDLVSGIRDVGNRFSVIGIPNRRPHGPCKETAIDMAELVEAIEFFVGPPRSAERNAL